MSRALRRAPVILGLVLLSSPAAAQDTLRLPALQQAAVARDPRLSQVALEEAATALRLRNIAAGRLPELSVTAEAAHQSEVPRVPIVLPNADPLTPPKDRYSLALGAHWLVYDGGVLNALRAVELAALEARQAELAAELEPLRAEVLNAYFSALLQQARALEVATLAQDLDARLSEVRARVLNGAALPGDTAAVRAEALEAIQLQDEAAAAHEASLAILAELTGAEISPTDVLAVPILEGDVGRVRSLVGQSPAPELGAQPRVHPRYAAFDAQRERLQQEADVVRARSGPQIAAFGEYAYGRPGPRQFTHDPHDYWTLGLRFRWAPWDWGVADRELEALRVQQRTLDTEEAAFSDGLIRRVQPSLREMERLRAAMGLDEQIVALREQVERQARAQLEERAITAADYVDARTNLQEARLAMLRHRTELARAQAEYLTTLGVELP